MATAYKNDTDLQVVRETDRKPPLTFPAPPPKSSRAAVLLALLAIYTIWGSTYLAIRIALESFPPFMMGALRFLIAGSILFVFMLLRGAKIPTGKQWLTAAIV